MASVRGSALFQAFIRPATDCADGELLRRFQTERDEAAFAELVHRHGPMVYGTCKRILNNGPDADDAFQATFFVLARKAGRIRSSKAIGAWLHAVAVKVARKAQQQAINRRVRHMAAAKPEAVHTATPVADWWAVIDDELSQLPERLRQVIIVCDIGGKSRSEASRELDWPEGTVAKRLAKARQVLANRLTQRGISLSVAALSAGLAAEAKAAVPSRLLVETISQAPAFAIGCQVGSAAARTFAEAVMRSMKTNVMRIWLLAGLAAMTLAGGGIMLAGGPGEPPDKQPDPPKRVVQPQGANVDNAVWKEKTRIEIPGWLPVSVAYSPDGKVLAVGGTAGKVIAYDRGTLKEKWMAEVGGNFAAVAYTLDGKSVLATYRDGVRFLDADPKIDNAGVSDLGTGKSLNVIEESGAQSDWRIMAVGVFPDRVIEAGMQKLTSHKIICGTPVGYIVKTWVDSGAPGTIKVSTAGNNNKPADKNAVPLAVDPAGSSAIITGPIDPKTGKNVLWAYVAGSKDKDSPGNRILVGHNASVVSAAWSKDGKTAVTGDADGRVIVWDAKTMKERNRVELGERIAALAITPDGKSIAAAAVGRRAEFYVWESAKPAKEMKPIQIDTYDYQGSVFGCLAFSPNGRQLAGCAIDTVWLSRLGRLVGSLHVWERAKPNQ